VSEVARSIEGISARPAAVPARRRGRTLAGFAWIAPAVVVLLALTVYPTVYMVYISLHEWPIIPTLPRPFVGLDQYRAILSDHGFWASVRTTGVFIACAVSIELTLGYLIAAGLRSDLPSIRLIRSFFLMPIVIAPVVAGLIWKFMLLADLGVVNYLIGFVGFDKIAWLGQPQAAFAAIIIVDVWQWTPFMTLILLSGLESLPTDPFEAARVDGAGPWNTFWHLTVPMLLPLASVALLFRTFDAVKTFDIVYVLTRGGPGSATQLISYEVWLKGFFENQLGYAAALSVVMLVILTVGTQIYFRLVRRALQVTED
jgi:multiple sugar transport system permease protein